MVFWSNGTPISPKGTILHLFHHLTPFSTRTCLRLWLRRHFGSPRHPVLDLPESVLIGTRDLFLCLTDLHHRIIATIRYHEGGIIYGTDQQVFVVDCFCVLPAWRKKGLGDYLLYELKRIANDRGLPHAIFLKEGSPLFIPQLPFYSGIYAYRLTKPLIHSSIREITVEQAYRCVNVFHTFHPEWLLICHRSSVNQQWRLWQKDGHLILACIQDTYQRMNDHRMAWITVWLESPHITEDLREEASIALTDGCSYHWIWMYRDPPSSSTWNTDGTFYWYRYQWESNHNVGVTYGVMV